MSVGGKQCYYLILYALYAAIDLFSKTALGNLLYLLLCAIDLCLAEFLSDSALYLLSADVNEGREVSKAY